jgi:hypothetical protein
MRPTHAPLLSAVGLAPRSELLLLLTAVVGLGGTFVGDAQTNVVLLVKLIVGSGLSVSVEYTALEDTLPVSGPGVKFPQGRIENVCSGALSEEFPDPPVP